MSCKAFLASAVVEDVELSASYLRLSRCDERFEIFAIIALEMGKMGLNRMVERDVRCEEVGKQSELD